MVTNGNRCIIIDNLNNFHLVAEPEVEAGVRLCTESDELIRSQPKGHLLEDNIAFQYIFSLHDLILW